MKTIQENKKLQKNLKVIKEDHGIPVLERLDEIITCQNKGIKLSNEIKEDTIRLQDNINPEIEKFKDLRENYLEELEIIHNELTAINQKTTELDGILKQTVRLCDEAKNEILKSAYKKKMTTKIKFHISLVADVFKIGNSEKDLSNRLSLYHNFNEYLQFLIDYVFRLAVYSNAVYFCKRCWCIYFRCSSVIEKTLRVDNQLVLLDKKKLLNAGSATEAKRDWFFKVFYRNEKELDLSEVPFPSIQIPGTLKEKKDHNCFGFFDHLKQEKKKNSKKIDEEEENSSETDNGNRREKGKLRKLRRERDTRLEVEDLTEELRRKERRYNTITIKIKGKKEKLIIPFEDIEIMEAAYETN